MFREFKINKYISVKLEGIDTIIYVAGIPYRQCAGLLLNFPNEDMEVFGDREEFKEIESIDDLDDSLNWDYVDWGNNSLEEY